MKLVNEKGYSIGVGVFIVRDGQLFLTHRTKGAQTGFWEVVAGHVEEGESPEETAVREAKEETGADVKIVKKLGVNIDDTHKFEGDMFLAEIVSGEPTNLDERHHSEMKWFPLNGMPEPLGSTTKKGVAILRHGEGKLRLR